MGSGLVLELPLRAGSQSRGEEQKKTVISAGKVRLKEKQNRRKKGGKRCMCANKGKPQLNNTMAA